MSSNVPCRSKWLLMCQYVYVCLFGMVSNLYRQLPSPRHCRGVSILHSSGSKVLEYLSSSKDCSSATLAKGMVG